MITAGSNFAFMHAEVHYTFLENVTSLLNGESVITEDGKVKKIRLKFSKLGTYFKDMQEEALQRDITWPIYKGDFLLRDDSPSSGMYST